MTENVTLLLFKRPPICIRVSLFTICHQTLNKGTSAKFCKAKAKNPSLHAVSSSHVSIYQARSIVGRVTTVFSLNLDSEGATPLKP